MFGMYWTENYITLEGKFEFFFKDTLVDCIAASRESGGRFDHVCASVCSWSPGSISLIFSVHMYNCIVKELSWLWWLFNFWSSYFFDCSHIQLLSDDSSLEITVGAATDEKLLPIGKNNLPKTLILYILYISLICNALYCLKPGPVCWPWPGNTHQFLLVYLLCCKFLF